MMKAKTELILYHCLWMADTMMRPTWKSMTGSFEEWSYRNGFLRQVQTLEAKGWLESRNGDEGTERVYRLTQKGYLQALGGCQPEERWNRGWDGKWRMVVFDLPEEKRGLRNELRKQLRSARFGGLQGSVWITPDPVGQVGERLKETASSCGMITFFEGATCCGESSSEVVAAAWDLSAIQQAYETYLQHLTGLSSLGGADVREGLNEWGREERHLWSECLRLDPLLPRELWPTDYLGEKAWMERIKSLRRAGKAASSQTYK